MPPNPQTRGWSRLVAAVAERVVTATVHDMHRAISDGAFRWVGPVGWPVRRLHDAVVEGTYRSVRASLWLAGELGAEVAGRVGTAPGTPSPASVKAQAIANGVVSDELLAVAPDLRFDLTLRHDGRALSPERDALRLAHPEATGRLAVLVHGLVDTEAVWAPAADGDRPGIAAAVAALGVTPVHVRYGTGRAVGSNGAALAELLESLVRNWPTPVTDLTIVGHSMGGLLARSACVVAVERGHTWTGPLTDVIYLGTPHLGSWLEKAANVGSWILRRSARSAPLGAFLDHRSRGIKDLRFGTLTDDLDDGSIDDLLTGLTPDVPWMEGVRHHLVVGRLGARDAHPLQAVFGDALVRSGSASGIGHRRRIGPGGEVVVVPVTASHTGMVHHPEVVRLVTGVLARPAVPAPAGSVERRDPVAEQPRADGT